jgi:hypothetical protein
MQPDSLILLPIAVVLIAALMLVRRSMKPAATPDATRLAGASLHQLQDIHGTLQEIAGYLKPAPVEIALHAKLTDPALRSETGRQDRNSKPRKVRAGTSR